MFIVTYRRFFYILSVLLVGASIVGTFVWGLNPGIDFKGGALLEVSFTGTRPDSDVVLKALEPLSLSPSVRTTGENGFIIRMKEITESEKAKVISALSVSAGENPVERRFDSIGPVLGKEAVAKSLWSIALVLLAIVLFVTFAFRKVSEPVASWKYGLITIVALLHDVLIPTGVFAFLGHYYGVEIDTLFVTALLVILGFSVHDTIVVFDRVRENLRNVRVGKSGKEAFDFSKLVGKSVSETFVRSINTSLTTLLSLIVLYIVGTEATRHFSFALIIGISVGTYSSVFIASPLLVTVEKWQHRR